jgi:hypothetical protein
VTRPKAPAFAVAEEVFSQRAGSRHRQWVCLVALEVAWQPAFGRQGIVAIEQPSIPLRLSGGIRLLKPDQRRFRNVRLPTGQLTSGQSP